MKSYVVYILLMFVNAALVNNFVLSRFLGCCPFLGVSKKVETALGMGMAVTFVMALASLISFFVQKFILDALNIGFMQTIAYILVIAALVQFVEMFLQKSSPTLYRALGVYLPLITTNCAVLGVTIINANTFINVFSQDFPQFALLNCVFNGIFGALGFTLAIVLMAGINERLELADIPKPLRGFSIGLITAGLMSIAFLGFSGLIE